MTIPQPGGGDAFRRVGYYYQAEAGGYRPDDVPYDAITHLKVMSLEVEPDGTVVLQNAFQDTLLAEFSERTDRARFSLTVAGGHEFGDSDLSVAASTQPGRERFAETAVEHVETYGFGGLDIDWEYPDGTDDPADPRNFTLLLEACRRELDSRVGPTAELTYPAAASPEIVDDAYEVENHVDYVDYISVMTYDYHGTWSDRTGFNSPLFPVPEGPPGIRERCTHQSMRHWARTPFPNDRLVVGIPFYGRYFTDVDGDNRGLFTEFSAGGAVAFEDIGELDADPIWHREARVPWFYQERERKFISAVDVTSVTNKCAYALANGFGGVFCWQLRHDGDNTLIEHIRDYVGRGHPNPRFFPRDPVVSTVNVPVRDGPGRENERIDMAPSGSTGTIVDGPIEAGDSTWFAVTFCEGVPDGWVPATAIDACRFVVGDAVRIEAPVPVHGEPNREGEPLEIAQIGASGEIVDGPVDTDRDRWWRVTWEEEIGTGWSPDENGSLVWTY